MSEQYFTIDKFINPDAVHPTITLGWIKYDDHLRPKDFHMHWIHVVSGEEKDLWQNANSRDTSLSKLTLSVGTTVQAHCPDMFHKTSQIWNQDRTEQVYLSLDDSCLFPRVILGDKFAQKTMPVTAFMLDCIRAGKSRDHIVEMKEIAKKLKTHTAKDYQRLIAETDRILRQK